jgi:hypothetical protein
MSIVAVYSPSLRDTSIYASIGARASLSNAVTYNGQYTMKLEYFGPYVAVNVPASDTVYFRVSFYITQILTSGLIIHFVANTYNTNVKIYLNQGGILTPALVNLGTNYGYAAHAPIQVNTWYTLEGKIIIDSSAGEITLKLNGQEVFSQSGIDTVSGYDSLTSIKIENDGDETTCNLYLSDIIIADNWVGLGTVYSLVPTGNGAATAWVGDYTAVDEIPPSDADYISTDALTADTRESFTFDDLPANIDTINGVVIIGKSKSTAAGGAEMKSYLRVNTTNYDSSINYLDVNYIWHQNIWVIDPSDSNAWTRAKVNALEIGTVSA